MGLALDLRSWGSQRCGGPFAMPASVTLRSDLGLEPEGHVTHAEALSAE